MVRGSLDLKDILERIFAIIAVILLVGLFIYATFSEDNWWIALVLVFTGILLIMCIFNEKCYRKLKSRG